MFKKFIKAVEEFDFGIPREVTMPVYGKLDEHKPLSDKELKLLNGKNRIDYSKNIERRKK